MNKVKKYTIILTTIMFVITLTGCFGTKNTPDMVLGNMLKSIKEGNPQKAKEYITDPSQLEINNQEEKRKFNLIAKNLEYEVKEVVKEEGETAVVKVRIANYNLNKILDEALALATENIIKDNPKNNNPSDEILKKAQNDALVTTIQNYSGSLVGGDINVNVIKKDGTWLVEFNEEIQNYILGDK